MRYKTCATCFATDIKPRQNSSYSYLVRRVEVNRSPLLSVDNTTQRRDGHKNRLFVPSKSKLLAGGGQSDDQVGLRV